MYIWFLRWSLHHIKVCEIFIFKRVVLRSIVNWSATTKQEMPTYDRAMGQIYIESWKTLMKKVRTTKYKMSDLRMRENKNVEN